MTRPTASAPVVRLVRWRGVDPSTGKPAPRCSLVFEGRAVVSRGTEDEVRAYARENGWRVEEGEL